jgi:hypothetical protein
VARGRCAHFTADDTETPKSAAADRQLSSVSRYDNTLTKTVRKRSRHPMLACSPASTLITTKHEPEFPHSESP